MGKMKIIPLKQIPNQELMVVLNDQNCILHLYQRKENLYLDLTCNRREIIRGSICEVNRNLVTYGSPYFSGLLFFADLTGANQNPAYDKLQDRFVLCYSPTEKVG